MAAIMTHQQKYETLEKCWEKWNQYAYTDDADMQTLEERMHHLITSYNASASESIENGIMVSQFIALKLQEEREAEERFVSPNYYYGVPT